MSSHGSFATVINCMDGRTQLPVPEETNKTQIKQAMKTIKKWGFPVELVGLWVNGDWIVEEIK